jgi:hypothetical protein
MTQNSEQSFCELIVAAADLLSITMAAEDVAHSTTFHFDDMEVTLTLDTRGEDHAVIYSVEFGHVPPHKEVEFYREFLDANLFWAGTGGATIGVETATGEAVLCLRVSLAGLTAGQVAATAVEMIEMGMIWKGVLAESERDRSLPSDDTSIRV